ncbi:hypothetical protein [uncultured Hymenobacter sp.]|uniref:hypothetical protein n=1 Tax=uncultured Hymenobacter sp. TaxID=170016 RepID=UPI0035CB2225
MISALRQQFNAAFTPVRYQQMLAAIEQELPGQMEFRVAETPIFVPAGLRDKLLAAGESIIDVLTAPDFQERTAAAIPAAQRVPHENAHTSLLALDFAVCRDEAGELTPQLIELQGFASLYAFQVYLADIFRRFYPIDDSVTAVFNVPDAAAYHAKMRELVLADAAPEHVILLELFPERQKTRIDFALSERNWGLTTVCLTKVRRRGRQLYYEKEGREIEIKRIYNRVIFDELAQHSNLQLEFNLTEDVNVEWVGHPSWFFRISKYTLPLLHGPYVPPSYYLDKLAAYPPDLNNYVLKPLFSFAGSGVKLHVTAAELDAITDKSNYLLQRKVVYEPVVQSPDGLVKAEIRLLYAWPKDAARPTLLTSLGRLSRGEMIGVDFNKNKDWVGGTACFFER